MKSGVSIHYRLKGDIFGARRCACPCNPCDCDPCTCGDEVHMPAWRISGYYIENGTIDTETMTNKIILCLAIPDENKEWQEVLLVDNTLSTKQVLLLLEALEADLHSMPAEIKKPITWQREVYAVPMEYVRGDNGPMLCVTCSPAQVRLLRQGLNHYVPEWMYSGPMALRSRLDKQQ